MRPEEGVVARRYARALMMLSKQRADSDAVLEGLKSFAVALDQVPMMRTLLESPLLTRPKKKSVLEAAFQMLTMPRTAKEFLLLLVQHGRMDCLGGCILRYGQLLDAEAGRVRAAVTTPVALTEAQKSDLVMALTRLFRLRVHASFGQDPALLGGVVVRVGNLLLDSSIKGKLEKLRQQLVSHT